MALHCYNNVAPFPWCLVGQQEALDSGQANLTGVQIIGWTSCAQWQVSRLQFSSEHVFWFLSSCSTAFQPEAVSAVHTHLLSLAFDGGHWMIRHETNPFLWCLQFKGTVAIENREFTNVRHEQGATQITMICRNAVKLIIISSLHSQSHTAPLLSLR